MDSFSIGMIIASLIEDQNSRKPSFHDHRRILLSLLNSLSLKYKKDDIMAVLCANYNDDIEDNTSKSIKKYVQTKDIYESMLSDMSSNDAEILIRCIPLTFYFAHHDYIDDSRKYQMIIEVTKMTHNHPISIISSTIYTMILLAYINDKVIDDEMEKVFNYFLSQIEYKDWINQFDKFVHIDRIKVFHLEDVNNSVYVIDALIAAMFSILTSFDYQSAIERIKEITSNNIIITITAAIAGAKYGTHQLNHLNIEEEYNKELSLLKKIIKNYNEF